MGQRTIYLLARNNKSLKQNFLDDYTFFRDWIIESNKQSIIDYNERILSTEIELLLINHNKYNLDNWTQKETDELIYEYLQVFCDYGPGKNKFTIVGPMMYTWRYEESHLLVKNSKDLELKRIWNYLISGRSIKNEQNYIAPDQANGVMGYWNTDEKTSLDQKLINLGTKAQQEAGIEYVRALLDETKDKNAQIIFFVERS